MCCKIDRKASLEVRDKVIANRRKTILVYKKLYFDSFYEKLETPYRGIRVKAGDLIKSKCRLNKGSLYKDNRNVGDGGVHVFLNEPIAAYGGDIYLSLRVPIEDFLGCDANKVTAVVRSLKIPTNIDKYVICKGIRVPASLKDKK